MWQEDIKANLAAVAAAKKAAEQQRGGGFDQLHPDEFLFYAYLQSGQDAQTKELLDSTMALLKHMASMPGMMPDGMENMVPSYTAEFQIFYDLERRDWKSAAALQPPAGAPPESQTSTYWARLIADGHLKDAQAAKADLAKYDSLVAEVKKGKHPWYVEGTGPQIEYGVVRAWSAYAEGASEKALSMIREAPDLQDKVGQGEVDIPAREMLADMLLELHRPQDALVEYDHDLRLSPNRLNGLYSAGMAAEAAGDKARAVQYYTTLLKVTDNGAHSQRPEIAHAKIFLEKGSGGSK
jgi:tetratricopeptide (TPR) repeat protein